MVYGRNLTGADGAINGQVKDALRCARTHLAEKKDPRARDSVTEDEIHELETKYLGADLPANRDWLWTGFCYEDGHSGERSWVHPNREFLIQRFLDEANADVGDYNRTVQAAWKADA